MKCSLMLGMALWLICTPFLCAQNNASAVKHLGAIDVLSDTDGVDFAPYLGSVLRTVKHNWYNLVPESAAATKKGSVSIKFNILKSGKIAGMTFANESGDITLDRAAWGGIIASNPLPPLPSEFGGQYLTVRFHFYYNPDGPPHE